MQQPDAAKLLDAIKNDDLPSFKAMADKYRLGSYRLGRFPVLSLCYLFGSRKLISAYERAFCQISVWESLDEPACISPLFSQKAGKCLRLYFNEVVTPLEMLLILDSTRKVKKLYPLVRPSEAVRKRLRSIYDIKYSLNVTFKGNTIVLDRRPLKRKEKLRVALASIGILLALAIIVAVPSVTVPMLPNLAAGEVTKLEHIDFASRNSYTLKKDIYIPDGFTVDKMNCSITGGGKKLIFGKDASLGVCSGSLTDITVQTSGTPIFETCNNLAKLTNVTVNVVADVQVFDDGAFVALTNYGTFDGVTVNVTGKVTAIADEQQNEDGVVFGGIVANNTYASAGITRINGVLQNCSVNFSNFTLEGELSANASFGGIAGINTGIVRNCSITGDIGADFFDIGGACYANGNTLSDIVNSANLTQTASDPDWSTVLGGVVIENGGIVERCKNLGDISATSAGAAICGGIVARSYGQISYCYSSGNIHADADEAYVGGIFGRSEVVDQNLYVYLGTADHCLSASAILATSGQGKCYAGGIGGYVMERGFDNNIRDEQGDVVTQKVYFGGGVTNSVFMGAQSGCSTFGNVVGVCGQHVYEANSYQSGGSLVLNFDGNVYVLNDLSAFGASIDDLLQFSPVPDKGATGMTSDEVLASDLYKDISDTLGL